MKKILIPTMAILIVGALLSFGSGGYSSFKEIFKLVGSSGNLADVDSSGQLHVAMYGLACTNNSTTNLLGANQSYTGTSVNVLPYAGISLHVTADQAGTLKLEYSLNESDWHESETYAISAGSSKYYTPPVWLPYFRVAYSNGATPQGDFHIDTMLHKVPMKWSSHNVVSDLDDEDDAELVKAVIAGKNAAGSYVNFQATSAGNFKISLEELESGISANSNSQIRATLYDVGGIPAEVDDSTHALQTVDYQHHELHSGSAYFIDGYADLAINNVYDMQFTTADSTKQAHFTFALSCESETLYEVWEGAVITNAGTTITPFNADRNSTNLSIMVVAAQLNTSLALANADTSTNGATLLQTGIVGAGRSGGSSERVHEMLLKTNTVYCFRAIATAAGYTDFTVDWYEHAPKN